MTSSRVGLFRVPASAPCLIESAKCRWFASWPPLGLRIFLLIFVLETAGSYGRQGVCTQRFERWNLHDRSNARAVLGDIAESACDLLVGDNVMALHGGQVAVLDVSWGTPMIQKVVALPHSMILGQPRSEECSRCVTVECMDPRMVAALALLAIDLGATLVHYMRLTYKDYIWRPSCAAGQTGRPAPSGLGPLHHLRSRPGVERTLLDIIGNHPASYGYGCSKRGIFPSTAFSAYMTDKGLDGHKYSLLYDALLPQRTCSVTSILEVGIGSIDPSAPFNMGWAMDGDGWKNTFPQSDAPENLRYRPGASLRAWLDIFPFAAVTGLDVDLKALVNEPPRLSSFLCNTLNATRVQELLNGSLFDIIVDDGNHLPLSQRATVRAMWPYLRMGGLYVIEDIALQALNDMIAAQAPFVQVQVYDGAQWLAVVTKTSHELPLTHMDYPNAVGIDHNCRTALALPEGLGLEKCCGADGVFPPTEHCFNNKDQMYICCSMRFVAARTLV